MKNKSFQKTASLPDCVTSGSQPIVNGAVKNLGKLHAIVEFCGGWRFCIVFVFIFSYAYNAVGYVNALGFAASETTTYPDGISDHAVHVDRRGVRTVSKSRSFANREESVTLTFSPANPDVCVVASTNIAYRNGRSIAIQSWDGGWTRETSWSDYAADGTRRTFSVTEASDSPNAVTNQISHSDFLGRTVATLTPGTAGGWLVTSNAYDGATSRLVRSETTGQPATTYLYDERGEMAATVQGGVTTASETRYENIGGAWWRVDVRSTSREGVTNAVATTRRQLTGLSNALRSRTVSIDPNGSTTTETSSFNPQTCELTTIRASDAATPLVAVSKFGRMIHRETLRETVYNYFDPLGRVEYSEVSNPEAGSYSRWSGLDESDNETDYVVHYYYGEDYYVVGSRTFDAFNRETSHTDTFGNTVTTTYDALGRPVGTSGATYPVRNEYDTANRTTALSTTRDGTAWDATHWNYDLPTGLVTNKVYADGSAVSYAYTPDGKLAARTWARGLATAYVYNPDGLLTGVSYSDATPAASLGYDAFQRLASASNAVAQYSFANDNLGTATNETATLGGTVSTLARELDSLKRLQGLALDGLPLAMYAYDAENRLASVSNAAFVAEYNYTSDGWDAGYGIALTNGVTLTRGLFRDFYRRSLITGITNSVNGTAINPLVYTYDKLNRVTSRNADTFGYNVRSEVTNATLGAINYAYAYDHIGNHTTSSVDSATTTYEANNLNQYTQISVLSVPSVDNPTYDLDGNMLTNGVWSYSWDAENRLVAAYSNNVCVVSNAYDHMSRRVVKVSHRGTETRRFVYDGWNLIQETISTASGTTTNHYIWGRDLSGTMQGAGGVGGLLAVSLNGAWCFPLYDANGSITAYINEHGVIEAEYIYDAFGSTIAASGSTSDTFRHRFSTKYYDTETGLYYYGYRFYDPALHRWLNRDPIEEEGGLNLYGFCGNDGVNCVDSIGHKILIDCTRGSCKVVEGTLSQDVFSYANLPLSDLNLYSRIAESLRWTSEHYVESGFRIFENERYGTLGFAPGGDERVFSDIEKEFNIKRQTIYETYNNNVASAERRFADDLKKSKLSEFEKLNAKYQRRRDYLSSVRDKALDKLDREMLGRIQAKVAAVGGNALPIRFEDGMISYYHSHSVGSSGEPSGTFDPQWGYVSGDRGVLDTINLGRGVPRRSPRYGLLSAQRTLKDSCSELVLFSNQPGSGVNTGIWIKFR
jgi:RHS repeat-associated protein